MRTKNLTLLKFLSCSVGLLFATIGTAQSPQIDFETLYVAAEKDAQIRFLAEQMARSQDLPLYIYLPNEAFIEATDRESSQVVYTVITDMLDPMNGGYTAFYDQIESQFDLQNATIYYGVGNVVNAESSRWISNNTAMPPTGVILITDSSNDRVMAFDRINGNIVNLDFVPADITHLSTPIEATPDPTFVGDVYVSDQIDDDVVRYDMAGTFISIFAGENTAILDNIRGIEWTPSNTLLVSVGGGTNSGSVAEFDATGAYLGNFVPNGSGGLNSPFDVLYWQTDGSYLVPDITTNQAIHRYDLTGAFVDVLLPGPTFMEQLQELPDGRIAVAHFTAFQTFDAHILNTDGTIAQSITSTLSGLRGIYQLGNGNLLVTNGTGVHEIDFTGAVIETKISGLSGHFIHEYGVPAAVGECGLVCPNNIVINLGPGECDALVSYTVIDTGNCFGGEVVLVDGLESGSSFPEGTTLVSYEILDSDGEVIAECEFTVEVIPFANPTTTLACNDLVQVSMNADCEVYLGADVILEGGPYGCYDDYGVYVDDFPGQNLSGQYVSLSLGLHNVTVTDPITGNTCWGQILVEDKLAVILECQDVTLQCGVSLEPVFTNPVTGVLAGSVNPALPIGPDAGIVTTSSVSLSLPGNAQVTDVNVSVNLTHTFSSDLDVFLIGPDGTMVELATDVCGANDNWDVTFDDEAAIAIPGTCPVGPPTLSGTVQPEGTLADYIGQSAGGQWTLMITDDAGGDAGTLNVFTVVVSYLLVEAYGPIVSEDCGDFTLSYSDQEVGLICDTIQILRTWIATDASGNTSSCLQTITVEPLSIGNLECPETYEGECGESTDPENTGGYPTSDGLEIVPGGVCNLFVSYWDKEFEDCGNGTKIQRTWTILDWCTQETLECVQVIKLTDVEGPWLECPADVTVGSDPWFCNRDVVLEVPVAEDHCGSAFTLTPSVPAGTLIHFGGDFWRVDDLPVGTHTITWTAVDDCDNESTCQYDITVVDDVPPVPNCDEHTVLGITFDNGLDEGLTKIYATTFDDGSYDNCGPVTFLARRMDSCIDFDWIGPNGEYPNNDGGQPESLDRGLTFQEWVPFACCDVGTTVMVELRVTDLSGNINSCMVEVEIQDKLPPLIVCPPDITVSCDFWFDAHETDGFEPTDGLEGVFGRVLDAYENDESDRQYVIIDDPGNNQLPQPFHWGLDGWADDNCDVNIDVRTRLFDDCSGNELPGGGPDYAVRLVERTFRAQDAQGNTSTCRQRIWVVDFDPFFITDTQCGLNNADDVRWPCDLVLTDCPEGALTPENLSQYAPNNRPIVNDDNCSIIGVTYEDQIFYFVDNACYKIVRTWTVIDWCQFEDDGEGGHYGYWTYVQVIKVHDEEGAEFLDCPAGPLTYCVADPNIELPDNNQVFLGEGNLNSSSCSVHVWEERTVQDNCSDIVIYDVKIYPYNGSEFVQIVAKTEVEVDTNGEAVLTWDTRTNSLPSNHPIRRYGLPYNDRFCSNWPLPGGSKDYHRVLWSVEDGCGNLSTCEYLFRLEDCKQPTPICVGLSSVVMPSTGSVTIWAKDFDSGSTVDDCTPHDDLLFSFSGTNYEPSREFDCDAIIANGSPSFLIEIWVADEGNDQNCNGFVNPLGIEYSERNKDFCTTFIVIDDNVEVCGGGPGGVGGVIETEEHELVELVTVNLTNPATGELMSTYTTSETGMYHFVNPLLGYEMSSKRSDDHKNGVSTLDLVKIQKHLLGIELLDSPYKLIAADANNSESVSALDLVDMRKLILGLYSEFPNNDSWRFVNSAFVFADPTQPWPFEETVDVADYTMGHDFIGVKIGDVNGNVVANATQIQTRNVKGVLEFTTAPQTVIAGQTVSVPVSAKNFAQILGYQFTMNTAGLNLTSVEAGALDMSAENVGVHANAITVSWNNVSTVSSSDVLFTLNFTATESGELSRMLGITSNAKLTEAEAYNGKEEVLDVALSFGTTVAAGKDFALFQNNPNPFEGNTVIGFTLPEAMDATVTVYDVTGKVITVIEGAYAQGYNEIRVDRKDLAAAGVMYYRLDASDFTATKKMVVIE